MLKETTTTDHAMPSAVPAAPSVIYVTPDCTDSAVQKRVRGLMDEGAKLMSFSFRRNRYNVGFVPDWPNIELGVTTEKRLFGRLVVLVHAMSLIFRHRRVWRDADVLYARNLDLALLALIGKVLTRCRAAFVYEVLDIHPAMTLSGIRAAVLRWLERRVLASSELLVVSSPAFLRHYFDNVQHYRGKSFLLENKWYDKQISVLPRKLSCDVNEAEPQWTIGWFGNIRCPKSLDILTELADAMPRHVRIYIRGCASLLGESKLMDVIDRRENMVFEGEYCAPDELERIYSDVHFNWCVDLCGGENSRWLLPNRIYEGGYFGVPAIAVAGHETGRIVKERNLGITLDEPLGEQLRQRLTSMTAKEYQRLRNRVESLPNTLFVDKGDLGRLLATVTGRGNRVAADCCVAACNVVGLEIAALPDSSCQHDQAGGGR